MKNPAPINLILTDKVRALGWVAEARDSDHHLCATLAWQDDATTNENLKEIGEFIARYEPDRTVTVFCDVIARKTATRDCAWPDGGPV